MSNPLPDQMTVIEISKPGGPEVLVPATRPTPSPGPGELLIKTEAAGVNRPDVMQRMGEYPPPPGASDLPGLEVAGTVAAVGDGVTGWSVGDTVCALTPGGGYAAYCLVPAPQCLPIPKLAAGDIALIHGGSSGIGTTAIQLASAFGARVFVTAGSSEKCKACEELGAERAINYREEDFVTVMKDITKGKGVDVVLDMVGGEYVGRNLAVLGKGGRLVQIAFQNGTKAEIAVHAIMIKQIVFTGSTLRPRPVAEKGVIAQSLLENVWPLIAAGKVKPLIHSTYPLQDASRAHALMDSSAHIGKIVLTV
jgi:NADPH:quinone reductase-like Zn-dependent oxidoreductase